jgi:hypothetical protein
MTEKSTFTKAFGGRKGGVFRCECCGKMTRDTRDNAGFGLCPKCMKECEEENRRADGEE